MALQWCNWELHFLGYFAMSLGYWCPLFWVSLMVPSSRVRCPMDSSFTPDPQRRVHHTVLKYHAPITQWCSALFRKNGGLKSKGVHVHTIKACRGRRGIAPLILNLGTRWRWKVSFMPRLLFSYGKNLWYLLNRKSDGLHSWSWCLGKEKNTLSMMGTEPRIIQPIS